MSNAQLEANNKQNHNINALRIVCTLGIVYFHIFSNLQYETGSSYEVLYDLCNKASLFVEFFLIVGGYYLWRSVEKSNGNLFVFIVDKIVRLWPVLAATTVAIFLINKTTWPNALMDLLFLRCTGISLTYKGIIWYIGPYFWCTILISAIYYCSEKKKAVLALAIAAYFCYAISLNCLNGSLGREVVSSFLSLGMLRVLGGLSLGALTAVAMDAAGQHFNQSRTKHPAFAAICYTVIEGIALFIIFASTLFGMSYGNNDFLLIGLFIVVLVCFVKNKGVLARLLNQKIFTALSKPCYSIYVTQQFTFYILGSTFWINDAYTESHVFLTIVITMIIVILVGVAAYLTIEKPATNYWRNYKRQL